MDHGFDILAIEREARIELADEAFRAKVEERKQQLRVRANWPWYKKLFPFIITITRI